MPWIVRRERFFNQPAREVGKFLYRRNAVVNKDFSGVEPGATFFIFQRAIEPDGCDITHSFEPLFSAAKIRRNYAVAEDEMQKSRPDDAAHFPYLGQDNYRLSK